ncbi:MAG TPA: TolC family protein [Steroidobacteraceae bacterium]|nr:TolC family protein [Steroidobacteraceae bacterium]
MSIFVRAVSACCILFLFGAIVSAQTVAPEAPLALRDAITAALRTNPDLKSFGFSLRVQDARIDGARLRPAPEFSTDVENVLGTGTTKGVDAAEATFALSQVIELGDKRARRVAAAQTGREVIGVRQQAAQLDTIAEVTRRFIHVASDQAQLELTRQATELARNTVDAVKRRVDAAKSPDVELYRATVELKRAEIELRHSEHELLGSRRKLAAMWGEPEAQFGVVQTDLYGLPTPATFDSLIGRLQANPDFTLFATETRLRDAEVRLVEAQRRANFTVTAGVKRLQESRDNAFVVGFSVPLFSGRQAAPAIAEARALREQVGTERDAAFVKARAQVFELYQELQHAINEVQVLRRDVLPQMEKALKETEYAYDRGRYSYLELVDGQRAYLDVQRALINAATNAQTLQTEIERLTGEPLSATQP